MPLDSSLNLFLAGNGMVTIGIIFNQNDSTKEAVTSQNSTSASNPLEKFTWGCVLLELILLLIQTKVTDF
jgi:hypothetical protein